MSRQSQLKADVIILSSLALSSPRTFLPARLTDLVDLANVAATYLLRHEFAFVHPKF